MIFPICGLFRLFLPNTASLSSVPFLPLNWKIHISTHIYVYIYLPIYIQATVLFPLNKLLCLSHKFKDYFFLFNICFISYSHKNLNEWLYTLSRRLLFDSFTLSFFRPDHCSYFPIHNSMLILSVVSAHPSL